MEGAQWTLMRALREGRRLSIIELARQIGLSREHLGRIERGESSAPGWGTVRTWAKQLGISVQLIDYIESHPEVDDDLAEWVARQVLAGYDEATVMAALQDRYGR